MVIGMFLAHLVGDYILQWDALALWKSKELKGVLAHGSVVFLVTLAFALAFNPGWWPWALAIGLTHTAIDALWLGNRLWRPGLGLPPVIRLIVDQALHLAIILAALAASGYLAMRSPAGGLLHVVRDNRLWVYALGYAFITMPAWIAVEFGVYGLVRASSDGFSSTLNKYAGIAERGLITTLVLLGQFALLPLVLAPRLIFAAPQAVAGRPVAPYIAELLASVTLAVAVGLGLRLL